MTEILAGPAVVRLSVPPILVFPYHIGGGPAVVRVSGGKGDYSNEYPNDVRGLGRLKLDRLNVKDKIANSDGTVTFQHQKRDQSKSEAIELAFAALGDAVNNQGSLIQAILETQKAISAVAANQASLEAQAAQQANLQRVRDSYSDPNVLSATNAAGVCTITILAHSRHYLDAQDVALNGGAIPNLSAGTLYFVYYDDPTMEGGAVAFKATTDNAQAVASLTNPYRHAVGSIGTATTAGTGTTGPSNPPPWAVEMEVPL